MRINTGVTSSDVTTFLQHVVQVSGATPLEVTVWRWRGNCGNKTPGNFGFNIDIFHSLCEPTTVTWLFDQHVASSGKTFVYNFQSQVMSHQLTSQLGRLRYRRFALRCYNWMENWRVYGIINRSTKKAAILLTKPLKVRQQVRRDKRRNGGPWCSPHATHSNAYVLWIPDRPLQKVAIL